MPVDFSGNYIMLAEDNAADVYLVREALSEQSVNCDLHVVADGEAAMHFIDQLDADPKLNCPDVLLLDLHLPKRSGEAILRRLRASERCGQTPVIILTSSDSPYDRTNVEKHAPVHYFRKPSTLLQFMELGAIVKKAIGRASAQ